MSAPTFLEWADRGRLGQHTPHGRHQPADRESNQVGGRLEGQQHFDYNFIGSQTFL